MNTQHCNKEIVLILDHIQASMTPGFCLARVKLHKRSLPSGELLDSPKVLNAPDACLAVKTGCDTSSGLLPSMVASASPVDAVLSPSWLMGDESEPTEELLWNSAVSSGIHGVIGCTDMPFLPLTMSTNMAGSERCLSKLSAVTKGRLFLADFAKDDPYDQISGSIARP